MEDIIRRFCAYGMEYKDHEGYTHELVTLLPEVELAYNPSQHSTTGKLPSLVEKGWNPPLKNAVEGILTEEFSRKHTVFQVSLVKPYFQTGEDKLPSGTRHSKLEDSPGPVKKIIKARKIRLNGKGHREYLVRFKKKTADKDKWLAEDSIPDGNLHHRRFRASRWAEQSHQ
ncbi:hypothetical protein O181_102871 [Austropuccinia psidii MF-1]|uniref:Uncharacterized protein n=1 Tax=Austropuccinia psidii MF-1 TaxID=1389203 RepID=A0A9Q3JJJ2_9BASI|nr:hypothetical protein [Austropuccinia psidii MF-1]